MGRKPTSQTNLDPYLKWLGIPLHRRPPTYFDLLGLPKSVTDRESIEIAARKQKSVVTSFRGGEHEEWAARLTYELEEATVCLLDPTLRQRYRRRLSRASKQGRLYSQNAPTKKSLPAYLYRQVVGEEAGIAREFAGVISVIVACFLIAFLSSSLFPWSRIKEDQSLDLRDGDPEQVAVQPGIEKGNDRPVDVQLAGLNQKEKSQRTGKNGGANKKVTAVQKPWKDLLSSVNLNSDVFAGNWRRTGEGLSADPNNYHHAALKLPAQEGSYEFECEFEITYHERYPGVAFSIPLGETRGQFSFWAPDWLQIKHVRDGSGSTRGTFSPAKKHMGFSSFTDGTPINFSRRKRVRLNFKVDVEETKTQVTVAINGSQVGDWKGGKQDIWEPNDDLNLFEGRSKSGIIIATAYKTVAEFHYAKIRPR
ncbi:hypothetical protein Pla110_16720 [Polystyrenella longa]|uniref:Uncharacterized protein n=1 Tax=Polystyrenella longa TaxID=2528007 RepID=A0A518CL50_9PLAN|nr:hypothetical protein [Polystyrenella longa]QDU79950.1 hypothetical protein Pla110_16720 [Polystyrenella longa]